MSFELFGPVWEKQIMQMRKKDVVALYKKAAKENLTMGIRVGEFVISKSFFSDNSISIYHESGEGGGFKKSDFAKVVGKFYQENF